MVETSLSINGEKFIKGFEGFCLSFYADSMGYPTVGYGHLITKERTFPKNTTGDANDSKLSKSQAAALVKDFKLSYTSPISREKAESMFEHDVQSAVNAVNDLDLPSGCVLSQNQFDALFSITFNGGAGVLETKDMKAMLKHRKIFAWDGLTSAECDVCSKLVSKAFSYEKSLKPRCRNFLSAETLYS